VRKTHEKEKLPSLSTIGSIICISGFECQQRKSEMMHTYIFEKDYMNLKSSNIKYPTI
jgi:hypothetical protein